MNEWMNERTTRAKYKQNRLENPGNTQILLKWSIYETILNNLNATFIVFPTVRMMHVDRHQRKMFWWVLRVRCSVGVADSERVSALCVAFRLVMHNFRFNLPEGTYQVTAWSDYSANYLKCGLLNMSNHFHHKMSGKMLFSLRITESKGKMKTNESRALISDEVVLSGPVI